jgi:hypothetical protein
MGGPAGQGSDEADLDDRLVRKTGNAECNPRRAPALAERRE